MEEPKSRLGRGDRVGGDSPIRTPNEGESSSSDFRLPSDEMTMADPLPALDPDATLVDLNLTGTGRVPPRTPTPRRASGIFTSAAVLEIGDVLGGRYEILQLLGEGGMGAVYKAMDRELERPVALKLIRPELASNPAILARFKQELLLAHQVTHKNVIRIYDLTESDGVRFITMEYIEGADLRHLLLDHGKFSPTEAVRIMRQVCLALDAAHAVNVIHRDLKPQNIMQDKQGRMLVMDFGLARSVDSDGMTQTGALVGTMEYMSPEQALGKELDQRSDIFALGLIFFELLTGRTPYKADTAIASLLKRSQERAIPAVELEPSIPKPLSDIVGRCLERDLANRYQNVQEILSDLDAWEGRRPLSRVISSPAVTAPERKLPWKWIGAGALAVAMLGTGVVFRSKLPLPFKTQAPSGPVMSLAILPFHNASGDPNLDWLSPSLAEMLTTDVGQSASLRTVSPDRLRQIMKDLKLPIDGPLDPQSLTRLAQYSNAQTVVYGQYVKTGDQIRIEATLQDLKHQRSTSLQSQSASEKDLLTAIDGLAQSVREHLSLPSQVLKELQQQAFRPSSKSLDALREYNEGVELGRQGKNLDAQKKFDAATQADPDFALAFAGLAQTYANLGYDSEAESSSRRAVELSQNLPVAERYLIEADHARLLNDSQKAAEAYESLAKVAPDNPDIQFRLASLYESQNNFAKAREHYTKVREDDPSYVDAWLSSGRVEIKSGDPAKGLEYLNHAHDLAVQFDNQEEKAAILQAMGVAYKLMDRPKDALFNYDESLKIKRELGDKRGIAVSLNEKAQAQSMLGDPAAAVASYNEALQIRREIGDKRGVGDTLMDLGTLYSDRGQIDEALKLYKESLQIQRDLGDELNKGKCLQNIGEAYLTKGQYEDALTYFQQALQIRESLKVPDDLADTLHNLAVTNTKLGQYDPALTQYLKALEIRRSTGDTKGAAMDSYDMGAVFQYQGRFGAALKAREEAVGAYRDAKDSSNESVEIWSGYAESLAQAGKIEDASAIIDKTLQQARELKSDSLIAQCLRYEGDIAGFRGDFKAAASSYDQSLQIATRAKDNEKVLLAKLALARNDLRLGRAAAAVSSLRALTQQAESMGLKFEATKASVALGEALVTTKAAAQGRTELERAVTRSERLGLRALEMQAEYWLGTDLRLSGNATAANMHYRQFQKILGELTKDAGDQFSKRSDVATMAEDAKHWLAS
jgi:serine/threonine protein kinase/Tfp pilus assembly protein PilF